MRFARRQSNNGIHKPKDRIVPIRRGFLDSDKSILYHTSQGTEGWQSDSWSRSLLETLA